MSEGPSWGHLLFNGLAMLQQEDKLKISEFCARLDCLPEANPALIGWPDLPHHQLQVLQIGPSAL